MVFAGRRDSSGRPSTISRAVALFLLASVAALVIVIVAAAVISSRVARAEAIDAANRTSGAVADVLTPVLTEGVAGRDPAALARLDAAVRTRIAGTQIVRVKLWTADGTILYSDQPALIGKRFSLEPDDLQVLHNGGFDSALSDLSRPENVYEKQFAPVVEVYAQARDSSGRPVLLEAYFRTQGLEAVQHQLAWRIAPAVLVPLGLLLVLLLPLAIGLARRIERHERDRHALVQLAAQASAAERRQVAGELHDGVIQDLSGVGYALAVVDSRLARAQSLTPPEVDELRRTVATTLDVVRGDVGTLRSMITNLYGSNLEQADLTGALITMAQKVKQHGISLVTDVRPLLEVSDPLAGAIFQIGREALRNAVAHSGASTVTLRLYTDDAHLHLVVADDGRGFEQSQAHGPTEGHFGLSLVRDAAAALAGDLQIDSAPGRGTTVTVTVPLRVNSPSRRWWHPRGRSPAVRSTVIDLDLGVACSAAASTRPLPPAGLAPAEAGETTAQLL